MPVQDKIISMKSVHKRWNILSSFQRQSWRPGYKSSNIKWQTLKQSASRSVILHLNVLRHCQMLLKYICYIHLYYKKVQPINPQMQHHPLCSSEVFRHWWVTIIKTPKVRKMTKATLFDSFYASHHNETVNYVADCADRPYCSFLKLINTLSRELDIRERRGGCAEEKYCVI